MTSGATFESLLGHFNSFHILVQLGARPILNTTSLAGLAHDMTMESALSGFFLGWRRRVAKEVTIDRLPGARAPSGEHECCCNSSASEKSFFAFGL